MVNAEPGGGKPSPYTLASRCAVVGEPYPYERAEFPARFGIQVGRVSPST